MQPSQSGNDELKVGQRVRVKISSINSKTNNISLVFLPKDDDPLHKLQNGDRVTGRVTHVFDDYALVDLGGIFATLHTSEISWAQWPRPTNQLKIGQKVTVKVIDIDRDTPRHPHGEPQLAGLCQRIPVPQRSGCCHQDRDFHRRRGGRLRASCRSRASARRPLCRVFAGRP